MSPCPPVRAAWARSSRPTSGRLASRASLGCARISHMKTTPPGVFLFTRPRYGRGRARLIAVTWYTVCWRS